MSRYDQTSDRLRELRQQRFALNVLPAFGVGVIAAGIGWQFAAGQDLSGYSLATGLAAVSVFSVLVLYCIEQARKKMSHP